MASALAHPIPLLAVVLGLLFAAVLPTCLYLYVEPRGRLAWGAQGDSPETRRAPAVVRFAAWLSFALGQLAVPWFLVPAACAGLLVLQAKLGAVLSLGAGATVLVGTMGLVQALLALGLIPLGVKLLSRSDHVWSRLAAIARAGGVASGVVLAAGALLFLGMDAAPGAVHPWLRTALVWTALRPVMAYAALGVFHAVLLGRCARLHTAAGAATRTRG